MEVGCELKTSSIAVGCARYRCPISDASDGGLHDAGSDAGCSHCAFGSGRGVAYGDGHAGTDGNRGTSGADVHAGSSRNASTDRNAGAANEHAGADVHASAIARLYPRGHADTNAGSHADSAADEHAGAAESDCAPGEWGVVRSKQATTGDGVALATVGRGRG